MDYRIIIAMTTCVLLFGDTEGTPPPGHAIPTLKPPPTSPVPTTTTTTTKRTTVTTSSTSSTSTALLPSSTKTMAQFTCFNGTCTTLNCSNSSFPLVKCTAPMPACVTEIAAPKGGDKHYLFRCATSNCSAGKKTDKNGTEVTCCNQPKCNTYEASLGSGAPCWTGITTLIALGLVAFQQLYMF